MDFTDQDKISFICRGKELSKIARSSMYCYLLNRCVQEYSNIDQGHQASISQDHQRDFNMLYRDAIIRRLDSEGARINNILANLMSYKTYTLKAFDEIVYLIIKRLQPHTHKSCSVLNFLYICIALTGAHFKKTGGVAEATDWAFNRMIVFAVSYFSTGNAVSQEKFPDFSGVNEKDKYERTKS